jgi:type I restriction enzyme R subunit
MDKKELSERDICTKFITPAISNSGWDLQKQIREEVTFTDGRIIVKGKTISRGAPKRADYILYYKTNFPLAVIEAKDNKHSVDSGMQQALGYADSLDIPFVYSSNGDGFIEHDRTKKEDKIERELSLNEFPRPEELFERYKKWKGISNEVENVVTQNYFSDINGKSPRYFQQVAINRTIEAIVKGQNRILLVMATGTGKTYTAFQIIWRLWKSGAKKRILFLVDRNVLADQTMVNDFKHFGDKMTKIKHRNIDKSYEIYLALYQGVSGNEEEKNIYKQFSPDFFDLVIVDECHRGSAADDSAWRDILEYYKNATQIGLTATPKETKEISNIDYFGEPIYTYSLRQGIEDGFLAPYRVVRITLDKDAEGWRPEEGKIDKKGNEIPDRIYNQKDYDKNLIIDERTELVAKKITDFLKNTNRFDKTIIFCVDINHAERMTRFLMNENADLVKENRKYIMRITGDNDEGKIELDNFINPESKYPVIAVTSKLMTTGVDAQTCKLIVLDTNINSITEFKQIIGRGTRVNKDFGKFFFTIIDFRKATELFADPTFDGDPVQIYEPKNDESIVPPDENTSNSTENIAITNGISLSKEDDGKEKPSKYFVNGVEVKVINERVQYIGEDGKLITESLKDYSRKNIIRNFTSLDNFLNTWQKAEQKKVIVEELENHGILLNELKEEVGKDLDDFDLICHIAFGAPALTRKERVNNVRKRNYFAKYEDAVKQVLNALLDKYADTGVFTIENIDILKVKPFTKFGSPVEIVNNIFGGRENYTKAIIELKQNIYSKV